MKLSAREILEEEYGKDFNVKDLIGTSRPTLSQQQETIQKSSSYVSGPKDYKNFTIEQSKSNLIAQLNHQNKYLSNRGIKYPHQKDTPFITDYMAETLSQAGVKDLRQLGYKEEEGMDQKVSVIKKDGKFFIKEPSTGYVQKTKYKPLPAGIKVDEEVSATVKGLPTRYLINKDTGERVVQGKYQGVLGYGTELDKADGPLRWGNTTQTEGMTDFMIKFDKDGQALIFPKYSDTATDLTGLTMVAGVALAAYGVPAALGKASGVTGAFGQAAGKAFGNSLISASFSTLQGGDFIDAFGKNLLTSAVVPVVSNQLDTVMGNTIFKNIPVDSTFRQVAAGSINRSVTSGLVAAFTGQDVGKAMLNGAARGGLGVGASKMVTSIFDESDFSFITDNTNLNYKQAVGLTSMGLRRGVMNLINGKDFTEGIGNMMVAYGTSEIVGTSIENRLSDKINTNPFAYNFIKTTSQSLTTAYIKAAMQGKQITPEQLQQLFINQALKSTEREVKKTINAPKGLGR